MNSITHAFEITSDRQSFRYDVLLDGCLIDSTRTHAEAEYQVSLFQLLQDEILREPVCDSTLDEQHERAAQPSVWRCPVEVVRDFKAAYARMREIAGGLQYTLITDNVKHDRASDQPHTKYEVDEHEQQFVNLLAGVRIIFGSPLVVYYHGCILQLYTTRLDGTIGQLRYEIRHWPEGSDA